VNQKFLVHLIFLNLLRLEFFVSFFFDEKNDTDQLVQIWQILK